MIFPEASDRLQLEVIDTLNNYFLSDHLASDRLQLEVIDTGISMIVSELYASDRLQLYPITPNNFTFPI